MKQFNSLLATFICLALFLVACEKEPINISKENAFNIQFKSTVNEQVLLTNENSRILLEIKSISDKRCRENHEVCPNPGNATVRFEVSNLNNSKAESLLHLGLFNEEKRELDSVTIKLDGHFYLVTLHGVNQDSDDDTEIETAELCVKSL